MEVANASPRPSIADQRLSLGVDLFTQRGGKIPGRTFDGP